VTVTTATTFRQAVQTELAADLGIDVVGGIREGRSEDRSIGYVWVARVGDAPVVLDEIITLGARIFLQWKQQQGTHRDVTAIEDLIYAIQASLRDKQTTLGPWMCHVSECVPDYENMHVTATIVGYQSNASLM